VSFGFAYSSWWALTGSIIWVPIGLVAFRESDVLGLAGACLLAVAVITALLGAGVGLRRLLRRSRRWQAYEDRRREPFGRLPFPMAVGFALLLAGLMWTADALSGSALIVYLVAMLTLWAAPLGETTTPAHQEQDAGEPSVSATGHVKGTLASVAFVCGAIVLSLLFSEVAAWIGLSQDNSEDGPVLDSASLWAVLLGFFVAAQGAARLTSQVRESA
jgi:amino acid permease